jgi:transcriptional regulator with XRE-family HTH domain
MQRNWRQQDVADQLGVTLITVQRWERGTQQPTAYYRIKLCALFGKSAQELGLVETIPQPPENTTSETAQPDASHNNHNKKIALWTVPYARNPHFTGRDELLTFLEQRLSPQQTSDQTTSVRQAALTQTLAIKGLGGIGKTQIAVEYAYRAHAQERYTHILWITAANSESILTSFLELANHLPDFITKDETDQRKLVAAIIGWLEECEQPWLLIFDNADEPSLVQPYLPRRGNGSILLTTRASAVGALAPSIEVDTMGVLEGSQLLLRRAHRFAYASDEEINEAANIAVALGQFPLALDQAGAYIEETECTLHDYFEIYQQHRYALLARRGTQATGYPDSVATTWSLSFEHVELVNPAAAELLHLCALMAPDHIPEELLTQGAPYWSPLLQQAVADPLTFNQLLEPLLSFSLVKRLSKDHLLSMHRLVQVVRMEAMTAQEQQQWAERLVRAVNAIFPHNPEDPVAAWPRYQRYLEQVQACDTLIQQHQLQLPEAAEVLERTGTYLRERALYTLAEPLYQKALTTRERLHALLATQDNTNAGCSRNRRKMISDGKATMESDHTSCGRSR